MSTRQRQIRLFLGVKVSMATIRALSETAEQLRRAAYEAGYQIRWVAPATYHITLAFLGWTQPEAVELIYDRLQPRLASMPSFEFTTIGLGAFPSAKHARVIWAGVDDPRGQLTALASAIADELEPAGFAREKRPFHAHVTLGRVKRVDDVSSLVEERGGRSERAEQNFRTTRVNSVALFESTMKSSGSEYTVRAEIGLSGYREGEKRQTPPLQQSREASTGEPSPNMSRGTAMESSLDSSIDRLEVDQLEPGQDEPASAYQEPEESKE